MYSHNRLRPAPLERRRELLTWLESQRTELPERIVDVAHERIWRKSSYAFARGVSYTAPVVFALLGGVIAWIGTLLPLPAGLLHALIGAAPPAG